MITIAQTKILHFSCTLLLLLYVALASVPLHARTNLSTLQTEITDNQLKIDSNTSEITSNQSNIDNNTKVLCDLISRTGEIELPPFCPPPLNRLMFVTKSQYNGNLGGIVGADAKCQAEADLYSKPGAYIAWISTYNPFVSVADRLFNLAYSHIDIVDVRGELIAPSVLSLLSNGPINPLVYIVDGQSLQSQPISHWVWTGTNKSGDPIPGQQPQSHTCSDWTVGNSQARGAVGEPLSSFNASMYTYLGTSGCNSTHRLYCIQK